MLQGGDEADLAAMSREESPGPGRGLVAVNLAARHSGGADAGVARKRGLSEVEIVPPAKRNRYTPGPSNPVLSTSPLFQEVSAMHAVCMAASNSHLICQLIALSVHVHALSGCLMRSGPFASQMAHRKLVEYVMHSQRFGLSRQQGSCTTMQP